MTENTEVNKVSGLSVSELANVPMKVQLGDLTLEVRQLKLKELFGHFEQKVRSKKLSEAQEVASLIQDGKNRNEFLLSVWKNLPSGTELTDIVSDTMQSIDGIVDIISLASGVKIEDIQKQIDVNDIGEITPVVSWIIGIKEAVKDDLGEDNTEKKTKA